MSGWRRQILLWPLLFSFSLHSTSCSPEQSFTMCRTGAVYCSLSKSWPRLHSHVSPQRRLIIPVSVQHVPHVVLEIFPPSHSSSGRLLLLLLPLHYRQNTSHRWLGDLKKKIIIIIIKGFSCFPGSQRNGFLIKVHTGWTKTVKDVWVNRWWKQKVTDWIHANSCMLDMITSCELRSRTVLFWHDAGQRSLCSN